MKRFHWFRLFLPGCLLLLATALSGRGHAQVIISADQSAPDASAMLDVKSTGKGFLLNNPSLYGINPVTFDSPPEGLVVFAVYWDTNNTLVRTLCWFDGTLWRAASKMPIPCGEVEYEGRLYHAVMIGNQCWMDENLNVGTRINGGQAQSDNSVIERYCYDDLQANCDIYGGLYQWGEAVNYSVTPGTRGICPPGWHMPTFDEYSDLINTAGGLSPGGANLKETGTAHWADPNVATNYYGFTALPGGYRWDYFNDYYDLTDQARLWSSTPIDNASAYNVAMGHDSNYAYQWPQNKNDANSVRCVRD